jgi:hypothetical protein
MFAKEVTVVAVGNPEGNSAILQCSKNILTKPATLLKARADRK